jgi:molecular chaperone DnaK
MSNQDKRSLSVIPKDRSEIVPSSDWRKAAAISSKRSEQLAKERAVVILLIDVSESMSGKPLEQARRGAIEFSRVCVRDGRSVGLISFGSEPKLLQIPCKNLDALDRALPKTINGSTAMHLALDLAVGQLKPPHRGQAICLVTDGYPDDADLAMKAANRAKALGIDISTISIESADAEFLSRLASKPNLSVRTTHKALPRTMADVALRLPRY